MLVPVAVLLEYAPAEADLGPEVGSPSCSENCVSGGAGFSERGGCKGEERRGCVGGSNGSEKGEGREGRTWRFRSPISRPSRISRASSLCPTSSKASVASWPPTSRRTSSPPLLCVSANPPPQASGRIRGEESVVNAECHCREIERLGDVRMLVYEGGGVVDLIVDDQIQILCKVTVSRVPRNVIGLTDRWYMPSSICALRRPSRSIPVWTTLLMLEKRR